MLPESREKQFKSFGFGHAEALYNLVVRPALRLPSGPSTNSSVRPPLRVYTARDSQHFGLVGKTFAFVVRLAVQELSVSEALHVLL